MRKWLWSQVAGCPEFFALILVFRVLGPLGVGILLHTAESCRPYSISIRSRLHQPPKSALPEAGKRNRLRALPDHQGVPVRMKVDCDGDVGMRRTEGALRVELSSPSQLCAGHASNRIGVRGL